MVLTAIETDADLEAGLAALLRLDPGLRAVAARAGPLPLRRSPPTLAGLARIVTAQQVSVASAAAIFARLEALVDPFEAATLSGVSDEDLGRAGLSRAKIASLRAVCDALESGLDLSALARAPADEAHRRLVALRGIGPWTADVFLLFCAGHPDIFPAGDLALREAVRLIDGSTSRPDVAATRARAQAWAPCRGIAARLLWAHYRAETGRGAAVPV